MSDKESEFIKSAKKVAWTFLGGLSVVLVVNFFAFYSQSIKDSERKTTEIQFIQRDILEMKNDIKDMKNNYKFEPKENLISQTK